MPKILLSIATLAVVALIGFFSISDFFSSPSDSQNLPSVGKITTVKGEATSRLPRSAEDVPIQGPRPFVAQEILSTGPGAHLVVDFASGDSVSLSENSRLVVEPDSSQETLQVTVLEGTAEILAEGDGDRVRVFKDGRRVTRAAQPEVPKIESVPGVAPQSQVTATEDEGVSATQVDEPPIATPTPGKIPKTLPPKYSADKPKTLTNEEITRTLASQGGRFQRCYLGLMQRSGNQNSKGTVLVGFKIDGTGKVTAPRVVRSPFKDQTLHNCLLEVVTRTQFNEFTGVAITVNEFPIAVE